MKRFSKFTLLTVLGVLLFSCEKSKIDELNPELNKTWFIEVLSVDTQNSEFPLKIINLEDTKISKKSSKNDPFKFSGFINSKERSTAGFWYAISNDTINIVEVYDYGILSSGYSGRFNSNLSPELAYFNKILKGKWKFDFQDDKMIWSHISTSSRIRFKLE